MELTGERRAYLAQMDAKITNVAEALHVQVCAWMVQLEDSMAAPTKS